MRKLPNINKSQIATFGLFGFLFWHFANQMLQIRSDGWYVGHINLYGDLVFHLSLINKFLESNVFLPDNPIFASDKINYPIFVDFLTAQISKVTDIQTSLFVTTLLGGFLTIFVARLFVLRFFRNEKVVFITLLLFFVNGGFGFYYFFHDYFSSQVPLFDFLTNLPRQYTDIKDEGYWWINNYLAYFLPQRGFLYSFPLTLTVIMLLYSGYFKIKKSYFFLAGILAGALASIQAHSLFLLFLISIFFFPMSFIFSKDKKATMLSWFLFAITTAVIALPILNNISNQDLTRYIRFDPGWANQENLIWFWLKNLGLFAPVLIISLIWLFNKRRDLFVFYLPFLAIFVISNIFVFQPWDFDNSKLLIYWFFVSSMVVAYFIYDNFFQEGLFKKLAGTFIVFIMIFAGGIDLFRTFTPKTFYRIFSKQDLEVATSVKNLTEKDSIFITASDHNHPIPSLTGRSTLLGFHGWAWSHGLDYQKRENDIAKIYLGGQSAESLISLYKINYVAVGPLERKSFKINGSFFGKYPVIALAPDWQIYDVSNIWSDSNR